MEWRRFRLFSIFISSISASRVLPNKRDGPRALPTLRKMPSQKVARSLALPFARMIEKYFVLPSEFFGQLTQGEQMSQAKNGAGSDVIHLAVVLHQIGVCPES